MKHHKSWTQETIRDTRREVQASISHFIERSLLVEAASFCLDSVGSEQLQKNGDLSAFCYILAALDLLIESEQARRRFNQSISQLDQLADSLLRKNKIRPCKSKLSYLYGEVKWRLAQLMRNQGSGRHALWSSSLGLMLSRGSLEPLMPEQHLDYARHMIDQGLAGHVIGLLDELLERQVQCVDSGLIEKAVTMKINAMRLSGRLTEAETFIDSLDEAARNSDQVLWEKYLLRAIKNGDFRDLHRFLFKKRKPTLLKYPDAYLKYSFFLLAQPSKIEAKNRPKLTFLRKMLQESLSIPRYREIFKILVLLEDCYDTDIPLMGRVKKVGSFLDQFAGIEAEYRIVIYAALARFFNQRQKQLASVFHSEYQAMSYKMSNGLSGDLYYFFANANELAVVRPFYDSLRGSRADNAMEEYEGEKERLDEDEPRKVVF